MYTCITLNRYSRYSQSIFGEGYLNGLFSIFGTIFVTRYLFVTFGIRYSDVVTSLIDTSLNMHSFALSPKSIGLQTAEIFAFVTFEY